MVEGVVQAGEEVGFSARGVVYWACAHASVRCSSVAVLFVLADAKMVDPLQRANCASQASHMALRSVLGAVLSAQCNLPFTSSVSCDQLQ